MQRATAVIVVDRGRRTRAPACRRGRRRRSRRARPRRYAVGLGARFCPPSGAGRSASQLNGPADSRACPLPSVAVTAGADLAADGSARKRSVVAASTSTAIVAALLRARCPVGRRPDATAAGGSAAEPRRPPIARRRGTRPVAARHAAGQRSAERRAPQQVGHGGGARGPAGHARASRRRSTGAARPSARSGARAAAISLVRAAVRARAAGRRARAATAPRPRRPADRSATPVGRARGTPRPLSMNTRHAGSSAEQDVVAALERARAARPGSARRRAPRCRTSSTGRPSAWRTIVGARIARISSPSSTCWRAIRLATAFPGEVDIRWRSSNQAHLLLGRVGDEARREHAPEDRILLRPADPDHAPVGLLLGHPLGREVGRHAAHGPVQDEARDALRVGRGVRHGDGRAAGHPEQREPLEAGRGEDRLEVAEPRLEREVVDVTSPTARSRARRSGRRSRARRARRGSGARRGSASRTAGG